MNHQHPLLTEWLTTQDVTLVPSQGRLRSRADAEFLPFIYSAPMDRVTGYNLTKAMIEQDQYPVVSRSGLMEGEHQACIEEFALHPNVFFAIGLGESAAKFMEKVAAVADEQQWPDGSQINIAIDVAHGDMHKAHFIVSFLSELPAVNKIMSGSICTVDAATRAIEAGCTHLRIGVGPGSACTTRIMTGVGLPNLSAVARIKNSLEDSSHIKLIADGGISAPGDAAKYLAAGADGIMLGRELSKTKESPGWTQEPDYQAMHERVIMPSQEPPMRLVKRYRGQASAEFQQEVYEHIDACPEGVQLPPMVWEGHTVESVVSQYQRGLASTISYTGGHSIKDLNPERVKMVKITSGGFLEGTPHGL